MLIPFIEIEKIATAIARSGLFGVKDPVQATALCLIAHAEGLHPAIAARDYSVIQGRPAKTSEAIQRTFLSAGGKIEWHTLTDELADATFSHPAGGTFRCSWNLDRARQAGLSGKESWKKYPRAMLRARCISEGCRTVFPGATSGMYTPEEVRDMPERVVSGEVVEMHRNEPPPAAPSEPPIGAASPAHKALEARINELGLDREGVKVWCARHFRVNHFPDLTAAQQRDLITRLPGFAVQKLQRQIPQMNTADLNALIKSPPAWLKLLESDCAAVLEAADKRLMELQTPAPPESPEPVDPTYGGDFQEQIAG